MKKLEHIIRDLVILFVISIAGHAQPLRTPAGLSSGLLAWYDGTSFDVATQQWNPRFGSIPLVKYAHASSGNITLSPNHYLNGLPVLGMEGVGLRAELLPTSANASFTIFAVSSRLNQIKQNPQYIETAWGVGGQSAYPGFVQSPGVVNQQWFRNGTNRTSDFVESQPRRKQFVISSMSFSYGVSEFKTASVNGESKSIDAGDILPNSNGYVYINANAAFPPLLPYQDHRFAEFIVYSRKLTDIERHRVHTYLSLKYAIPLLTGPPEGSQITIDGTTDLWDSTKGFNKDVIGVGRYDAAGLHTRSSYGIDPDIFVSTVDDVPILNNNTFLLIGDKGSYHGPANVANTLEIPGGRRLKRIWRVQNSGFEELVYLRTPSTVPPDGGLSMDACSPVRLLISSDSTFTTYRAVKLTPFSPYGTSVPPLFSAYTANIKFQPGESYITYASVSVPGTPVAVEQDCNTQIFDACGDEEGFRYFTDDQGRPVFAVKGLSAFQIAEYGLKAKIKVLEGPISVTNGSSTSVMMKRLLNLTSSPFAPGVKAAIRFYFTDQELAEAKVSGGANYWFKKTGISDEEAISDFAADGTLEAGTFTVLTGIEGEQNGTPYVEFRNLESFSTFGFVSSMSSLPVKLLSFKGKRESNTTQLVWETTGELNSDYFEIQRSTDAYKWRFVGTVKASGVSISSRTYIFADQNVADGDSYYRLKMVDLDGSASYSQLLSFPGYSDIELILYPNPVEGNSVRLRGRPGRQKGIKKLVFLNQLGATVLNVDKNLSAEINIDKLQPGLYMVYIMMDDGDAISRKLIVK